MVYILELKTTQAAAMKIVTDAINSLLTDANFDFYPYYIEENDNEDEDSDNKSDNLESDNDYESESDEADSSDDSDSEQYIKKKVTKKNQKNKEKETKKSSNKKEEKTPEKEGGDEVEKKKTIGGVVLKEVNKTVKILVYMRLDADKFDVYKYNYHKKKLTLGIDIGNLLKCLKCMSHFDTMSWLVDDDDINKLIVVLE